MLQKLKHASVDDKTTAERQRKGKTASNYRPNTCQLLVWKLLEKTKRIQEKI